MRMLYMIIGLFSSLIIANQTDIIKMNSFDLETLLSEDANRQPGTPERYAYSFNTDIDFFESGTAEVLDNGDIIWRLRLQSDDAVGMKVYFNDFYIPEESNLLIKVLI